MNAKKIVERHNSLVKEKHETEESLKEVFKELYPYIFTKKRLFSNKYRYLPGPFYNEFRININTYQIQENICHYFENVTYEEFWQFMKKEYKNTSKIIKQNKKALQEILVACR